MQGRGAADGEGTNPMQEVRITTATTNNQTKHQWRADNDDYATPLPASMQSKKAAARSTTHQSWVTVTKEKTKPSEATTNYNQQTLGAKNEEAVMVALGNNGQCGVRWIQQRQRHRMQ